MLKRPMRELIHQTIQRFEAAGISSPEINARMIWAHVMGLETWELTLRKQEPDEDQRKIAESLISAREKRIPLQHLLGSVGFCGLQLDVCSEVLIPRPETELLVETALKIAQEMDHADLRCLDMATGSGCIALSLAEALPESTIVGVDLSNDALKWAKHNAEKNRLSNRVNWVCSDLWESLTPGQEKWDIVTCNPPYIATHEIQTLEPEVRDHDPVLALDGGVDGLDFYRRIASEAVPFMRPAGKLILECGMGQASSIIQIFISASWFANEIIQDYNRTDRIIVFSPLHESSHP